MKRVLFLLSLLHFFPAILPAQIVVSTLAHVPSNGDVAVDADGFVYTVSENAEISRISPQGVIDDTPFLTGGTLNRGTGLAFDPSGDTLYVACRPLNGNGFITKVLPDGSDQVFCSNLYFPGDISFDPLGNMYVTEFNNNVTRITPAGISSLYINSPLFNTPIGIAWTPGDTLFVASAHDGNIYKVIPNQSAPIVQWFAHVNGLVQNWACGFMTYNNGALYITNGDNIIHLITLDGMVSDYAGNGTGGWVDGNAASSQFQAPNGITATTTGDKIYVTEYNQSRVREINIGATNIESLEIPTIKFYPNPGSNFINIDGPTPQNIRIITKTGIEVKVTSGTNQINIEDLPAGVYIIEINYSDKKICKQLLKM
ncbi:MAG: T9SS type A sorting domain-containing protein [Saprospiraceae bacterium]|nr:T9SS type A sorting domain-containing protein [Saprospiraceae bacterium]